MELFEEINKVNALEESLMVFEQLAGRADRERSSFLLVLNKVDLLPEALRKYRFRVETGPNKRFEDYSGPSLSEGSSVELAVEGVLEYLTDAFLAKAEEGQICRVITMNALNASEVDERLLGGLQGLAFEQLSHDFVL